MHFIPLHLANESKEIMPLNCIEFPHQNKLKKKCQNWTTRNANNAMGVCHFTDREGAMPSFVTGQVKFNFSNFLIYVYFLLYKWKNFFFHVPISVFLMCVRKYQWAPWSLYYCFMESCFRFPGHIYSFLQDSSCNFFLCLCKINCSQSAANWFRETFTSTVCHINAAISLEACVCLLRWLGQGHCLKLSSQMFPLSCENPLRVQNSSLKHVKTAVLLKCNETKLSVRMCELAHHPVQAVQCLFPVSFAQQ